MGDCDSTPLKGTASRLSNNRGGMVEEPGGMECRVHAMEIHESEQSRDPARAEQTMLKPTRAELKSTRAEQRKLMPIRAELKPTRAE